MSNFWGEPQSVAIVYTDTETKLSDENCNFLCNAVNFFEILLARQAHQNTLKNALLQAQAAERAKSFFLASMSHEIRTPLNAVIGFTELLKDQSLTDDAKHECINDIANAGNALLILINDILDLSKLEADQMPILNEKLDFVDFTKKVCHTFTYEAQKKNLKLEVVFLSQFPPVSLDQRRLRQIIFNLVGNAIKYTNRGFVKLSAEFTPKSKSTGNLSIVVKDSGVGIAPKDQQAVFQPFTQLTRYRGTCADNSGTGLGLPIVHKLVTKMGGTITLESQLNEGSSFIVNFPDVSIL